MCDDHMEPPACQSCANVALGPLKGLFLGEDQQKDSQEAIHINVPNKGVRLTKSIQVDQCQKPRRQYHCAGCFHFQTFLRVCKYSAFNNRFLLLIL